MSETPQFGRLLQAGFKSVGITYITINHLRKANKNVTTEREYVELWKLLYDLVIVVLLDFQVDVHAMTQENSTEHLESTLLNPTEYAYRQEIVRFYLYEWGFVSHQFYMVDPPPTSSVLLLALTWLLAYSSFLERQHQPILQMYLNNPTVCLPPYPNDIAISSNTIERHHDTVLVCTKNILTHRHSPEMSTVQSLFGRIRQHRKAIYAYKRYYKNLCGKLKDTTSDTPLPLYALHLIINSSKTLDGHVRALYERLQMIQDEKILYKWVNSLLLRVTGESAHTHEQDSERNATYRSLCQHMMNVQVQFQQHIASYQLVTQHYHTQLKHYQQHVKSRRQWTMMEMKMEKLTNDIQTNELWDIDTLFIEKHKTSVTRLATPKEESNVIRSVQCQQLQTQLERVMDEIIKEYCHAQLR